MKVDRIYDSEDHLTLDGAANGTRWAPVGSILIVVRGMILAREFPVGLVIRPVTFNQDLKALETLEPLEPKFLYYWLKARTYDILGVVDEAGHGTKRLQSDRLMNQPIRFPSRSMQRRMVDVLCAYDDLIANNQKRIGILEGMARALYREWFVDFRFPGCENSMLVPSVLGPIPSGWSVVAIDGVCDRVTDGAHVSPSSVVEGMRMVSSKDMHDWGLRLDDARIIGRQDFDDLVRNGCQPTENDVLVTKDGANYLKHIFVMQCPADVVLLSSIAILRPGKRINPHLLAASLKDPANKERLRSYVTGAAIPRVILKDFKRFQIVLPSAAVQGAWARIAEPMAKLCWQLVDRNATLRATRDLLLPRLISGELDVSRVPEPASL